MQTDWSLKKKSEKRRAEPCKRTTAQSPGHHGMGKALGLSIPMHQPLPSQSALKSGCAATLSLVAELVISSPCSDARVVHPDTKMCAGVIQL